MYTKKDWGDTAYYVFYPRSIHPVPPEVKETKITKIGNKYLYCGMYRYHIKDGRDGSGYSYKETLFPTEQMARDHIKRNEAIAKVTKFLSYEGNAAARKMPLEKLEQLLKIFTEE